MKSPLLFNLTFSFITCLAVVGFAQNPTPQKNESKIDTSKIVWHDEFDYDGKPDPNRWSYDIGGHGWGNNENQFYTNKIENAKVVNGILVIKTIKETIGNNGYSSARLVSKNKGDFLYGRIEVKAKLPSGRGTWPAIWMLASQSDYGQSFWPDNGEIDIMEHVGYDPNVVHGNIHTKAFNHTIGTNKGNSIVVNETSDSFHVYAVNWFPNKIEIEVDNTVYFTFIKENNYQWQQWPFDKPFHVILNIAIGGGWGGKKGIDDSIFPQEMAIDYVRYYGLAK